MLLEVPDSVALLEHLSAAPPSLRALRPRLALHPRGQALSACARVEQLGMAPMGVLDEEKTLKDLKGLNRNARKWMNTRDTFQCRMCSS